MNTHIRKWSGLLSGLALMVLLLAGIVTWQRQPRLAETKLSAPLSPAHQDAGVPAQDASTPPPADSTFFSPIPTPVSGRPPEAPPFCTFAGKTATEIAGSESLLDSFVFSEPTIVLTDEVGSDILGWLPNSNQLFVSPDNRWTPLQITWAGVCPSLMLHDEDCTASVQVQNTGVSDWDCSTASYALRYRWVKTGFPETTGSGQASLCGLAKGNAVTVSLNINDLPNWGAGAYTLKLDVTRTQSSQTFWFSNGGWPAFDIGLCVDGQCKAFVPHLVK